MYKMEKVQVVTIFRKFPEGAIIAIFPDEAWYSNGNLASYMRIGQHSGCSPQLIDELEEPTDEEAAPLRKELEALGYVLLIDKCRHCGTDCDDSGVCDDCYRKY